MKAAVLFTGTGPILILTSYESLNNEKLVSKLASKGIKKFIAYEVPVELAEERYATHYKIIMKDLKQDDDLRVQDYDGHHIFNTFSWKELGNPHFHEP